MSDLTIRRLTRRERRYAGLPQANGQTRTLLCDISEGLNQIEAFERSQCTLIEQLQGLFKEDLAAKEDRHRHLEANLEAAIIVQRASRRSRPTGRDRHLSPVRED
jgi:hypothetical protein